MTRYSLLLAAASLFALADDVKSHHVRHFIGDTVRLVIPEQGQAWPLAERAQPCVQQVALFHRPDDRRVGAGEFHRRLS